MYKNMYKGLFVVVDGPNGSGKSTIVEKLSEYLLEANLPVYLTKEPTNSELGNTVRSLLQTHSGLTGAYLVAADRAYHIEKEIIPALADGKIVVCDRYILSSFILQCMDGISSWNVRSINERFLFPDIHYHMIVDKEILKKRLLERDGDRCRLEGLGLDGSELEFMRSGLTTLNAMQIPSIEIDTSKNIELNVLKMRAQIYNMYVEKQDHTCDLLVGKYD